MFRDLWGQLCWRAAGGAPRKVRGEYAGDRNVSQLDLAQKPPEADTESSAGAQGPTGSPGAVAVGELLQLIEGKCSGLLRRA